MKLYQAIARAHEGQEACTNDCPEMADLWRERLGNLIAQLPSESGFSAGTKFVSLCESSMIFSTEFAHLDEGGSCVGWTNHFVYVGLRWSGLEISVTGPNRNDIKEYIKDVFAEALDSEVEFEPETLKFSR